MKKATAENLAIPRPDKDRPGLIKTHEHIHAANCGHRSYVHGDHIDYEHDGHYHYVVDGFTYECTGPNAKIIPITKNVKK